MDQIHYTPVVKLSETEHKEAEEFWADNKDGLEKELATANSAASESSAEEVGKTESSVDETKKPADTKKTESKTRLWCNRG